MKKKWIRNDQNLRFQKGKKHSQKIGPKKVGPLYSLPPLLITWGSELTLFTTPLLIATPHYNLLKNIASSQDLLQWYWTQFLDQGALCSILQRPTSIAHGTLQDIWCYGRWCLGLWKKDVRVIYVFTGRSKEDVIFIGFIRLLRTCLLIGSLQDGSWS